MSANEHFGIKLEIVEPGTHRAGITGADWFYDEAGELHIKVSRMSDWRYTVTLLTHELVEALMCRHNGVTPKDVDEFDMPYARTHEFDLNAGDEPDAPYRHEHCLATAIERILAAELDIIWKSYDDEVAKIK
jgi:hypothetical protein